MGKITLDAIMKIAEVMASITVAIIEVLKGGRKKDDSTGSTKKE